MYDVTKPSLFSAQERGLGRHTALLNIYLALWNMHSNVRKVVPAHNKRCVRVYQEWNFFECYTEFLCVCVAQLGSVTASSQIHHAFISTFKSWEWHFFARLHSVWIKDSRERYRLKHLLHVPRGLLLRYPMQRQTYFWDQIEVSVKWNLADFTHRVLGKIEQD